MFEDVGHAVGAALLDHIGQNPITRIPLSCYRSVENVRDDISQNLAKYSQGNVNVCGVNHFSSTNTKVGKQYQKTEIPFVKKDGKKNMGKNDGMPLSVKGKGPKLVGTFGKKPPIQDKKKPD